ncbi:MAG: DUF1501 domain-containing protein [Gammaproteobacteria bacterium]|nr:DUF1501 domain-containing protein [Gammaproteobacteria bacterium]
MRRRELLRMMGAGLLLWQTPMVRAGQPRRPKLVWVLLRGGMDSLHAIIPGFDDHLVRHRPGLVDRQLMTQRPLARGFALHPALAGLYDWYQRGQLLPIVAVASEQRSRSHFKAQDILESGVYPVDHDSGWLNRALAAHQGQGLALAHSVPISLRGAPLGTTWYPSQFPNAEDDTYTRLLALYQNEPLLSARLEEALATREQLQGAVANPRQRSFADLAAACGSLMGQSDGPDCAMLEMGGWDTHNNQASRLGRRFAQLDAGLVRLRQHLAASWEQTTVIVATEFGRTVAENGTGGSDHGTGTALLLAGGAVQGGRVLGEWPGLGHSDLFEGRDLMPTSSMQAWIGAVLGQHWGLSAAQLQEVFPGVQPAATRLLRPTLNLKPDQQSRRRL